MGGWVFHTKIDFAAQTPSISLAGDHPGYIKTWIAK